MVEQNAAHVEAVTPLKVRRPLSARLLEVALVDRRVFEVSFERLVEVVAATRPFSSVERTPLMMLVSHVLPLFVNCVVVARVLEKSPTTVEEAWETKPLPKVPRPVNVPLPPVKVPILALLENRALELAVVLKKEVEVACVRVTLPVNVFAPVQLLMSASSVEEAAVTVMDEPRAKSVPLIVPKEPLIKPEPMVVVDTTRPFSSVARSAEVRLVTCKLVVVAFTAKVLEAMSRVPLSHIGVVVLCTATPS